MTCICKYILLFSVWTVQGLKAQSYARLGCATQRFVTAEDLPWVNNGWSALLVAVLGMVLQEADQRSPASCFQLSLGCYCSSIVWLIEQTAIIPRAHPQAQVRLMVPRVLQL